jgi:hypothetical protein
MSVTSTPAATPRLHASACSPLAAEVRNAIPRELLRLRRNNGFWTDGKTPNCAVLFTHQNLTQRRSQTFPAWRPREIGAPHP